MHGNLCIQGKGVTSQEEVARMCQRRPHTQPGSQGWPSAQDPAGSGDLPKGPRVLPLCLPQGLGSQVVSLLLPSLKNMGALSSPWVKQDWQELQTTSEAEPHLQLPPALHYTLILSKSPPKKQTKNITFF